MNGIVAMSQLLRATELNDEQVECVDTIIESSDVMLTLLNDLLLCCKIDAGKFLLRPEPCRLAKILKHCHHMMTARLRHRAQQGQEQSTLEFQMDVDPNIPPCILADSDRLKQVLVNLLDNAFKFSAHGRIDLIVKMVDSRLTIEQDAEKKPPSGQPPKTASSAAASAGECKELPREQRQFVEMVQSSPEYAKTNGDDVVVSIHHAVERDPTPPSTHSVTIQFTVKDTGQSVHQCNNGCVLSRVLVRN
jgi:signal transduction histidine kinase